MDFVHPENTAKAGITALKQFLKSIGMPSNFSELVAKEEDIFKVHFRKNNLPTRNQ